jgi:hypothetical protein
MQTFTTAKKYAPRRKTKERAMNKLRISNKRRRKDEQKTEKRRRKDGEIPMPSRWIPEETAKKSA